MGEDGEACEGPDGETCGGPDGVGFFSSKGTVSFAWSYVVKALRTHAALRKPATLGRSRNHGARRRRLESQRRPMENEASAG